MQNSVFPRIAVRSHGREELGSVGAGDDVLGPVVIDATAGKIDDLYRCSNDGSRTGCVREADDPVGVRDVKLVTDQRHAEGGMQIRDERRSCVGDTVAVGVAEQNDPVRAWHPSTGSSLEESEEKSLDTSRVVGTLGRVRLGYEHVTIGKNVERARVVQTTRKGAHG